MRRVRPKFVYRPIDPKLMAARAAQKRVRVDDTFQRLLEQARKTGCIEAIFTYRMEQYRANAQLRLKRREVRREIALRKELTRLVVTP